MEGALGLAICVHDAYIRAHNSFNNFESYLHTSQGEWTNFYEQETTEEIRELASKLLAAFEYLGLPDTAARFRTSVKDISPTDFAYSEQMAGIYSTTLEVFRPYVEIVEAAGGLSTPRDTHSEAREVLKRMLSSAGRYLFLRDIKVTSEPHLQREIFPLLRAAFPDATREVPIPHVAKTYKADFGVPSLSTLVEFKYCDSKSDWPDALDGVYTDMKGYGSTPEWKYFYVVFFLTDRFTTQQEVDAEFLVTSSQAWTPIVVFGGPSIDQ